MSVARSLLLAMTLAIPLSESVMAQKPRTIPQSARKYYLDEPRTRLEEFEDRLETVIVKGFMSIGSVSGRNGSADISAVEIRVGGNKVTGLAIQLSTSTQPTEEIQSFIDYEEIDPLLAGLDAAARASDSITKMPYFSVTYRTRDDFTVVVFKQTRSGTAVRLENSTLNGTGGINRARILLTLDDLNKLRGMILEGKQRLDELN